MGTRFRYLRPGIFVLSALMTSSLAYADSVAPPFSYKQESPNGKYVFVMIAPMPVDKDARNWNAETAAKIRDIRSVYSRSGLYRNDGSNEPIWTVEWYAVEVEVASDGIHLIRHGPWASSTDQEAISFFASGMLQRTYQIKELVDNPLMLEHSVSHFDWEQGGWFDDRRLQYTLLTKDGNQFVFDLQTGDIVSKSRPTRSILGVILLVVGASVLVVLAWQTRTRWRLVRSLFSGR